MNQFGKTKIKAFTLVETVLNISLIAGVILALSMFYSTLMDTSLQNRAISEVSNQASQIFQHIKVDINESNNLLSPVFGATQTSLQLSKLDSTQPRYYLQGTDLYYDFDAGADTKLNSNWIKVLKFNCTSLNDLPDSDIVRIEMQLSYQNSGARFSKTFYESLNIN